jgi:hypothetical protein
VSHFNPWKCHSERTPPPGWRLQSPQIPTTNNRTMPRVVDPETALPMSLLTRLCFNAVLGDLGGLLGWVLFGAFADAKGSGAGFVHHPSLIVHHS